MARTVEATPQKWIDEGVWYVPDVGTNQASWREFRQLRELGAELDEKQTKRLEELRLEVSDLFEVKIGPYSHTEVSRIEGAARKKALQVTVDKRAQEVTFTADPMALGEESVFDVCAKRIFEVRGYVITEAVLDPKTGETVLDADGRIVTRSKAITTGAELVKFIRTQAEPTEYAVLEDIYEAIRNRSHLTAGQKKTFPSPPAS